MVRSELIRKLGETHRNLSFLQIEAAVAVILNEITDSLAQGNRVEFRGFGSFASKIRDARMGRNPRNGDAVAVDRKQVATFKASQQLVARLNHED
ncbi:integration host factor subunit beta (plasmid) [Paracoccus liaowanqingii]|uniref:Integration host factor subunit beta n=1 Tax=Paracoccus liaowanqingii TaxID=2560053 RepID=A0A4Y5SQ98_9RHOB|nr:HU family DNA-binding protein [Paracoccus liaowanqingii]QDA35667.1 integration host factor subunit beta [Paracoccus liaowanqingii]